jgi:hypothetical protein
MMMVMMMMILFNTYKNAQRNTMTRSRNHCCRGNAIMNSLLIAGVDVNNTDVSSSSKKLPQFYPILNKF